MFIENTQQFNKHPKRHKKNAPYCSFVCHTANVAFEQRLFIAGNIPKNHK